MALQSTDQARLDALLRAPLNRWIALSRDESRIIADGDTFAEVAEAAEKTGEEDPILMRVPDDWRPRTYSV